MRRRWRFEGRPGYLQHVRDAIAKIESCAAAGKGEFLAQSHWQDAIIRQREITGEASKRLSPALREAAPEIPWRRICGLRDVLIHNYMGVDLEAVWAIVEDGIPALKVTVDRLLTSTAGGLPDDLNHAHNTGTE